ncbi:hypothetical protein MSG28_014882, partial [Choristoneura fumiferana]
MSSDKHYTYLGVAKSEVNEEGDVKIMFYKTVDKTGKIFKAVETDISYEPYDNILEIVPNPKIVTDMSTTRSAVNAIRARRGHKERSKNFTELEKRTVLELIARHRDVLRQGRSNNATNRSKQ